MRFTIPSMHLTVAVLTLTGSVALAQDADVAPAAQKLWPDGAPGAKGQGDADTPVVRVYSPTEETNTGAAVVVCPGGGYAVLATDHEGAQVARYFQSIGVTGVVLRYRHSPYRHPIPLGDAQRALRWVRAHAKRLGVSPTRIGVMGFSAGGHLASTLSTHFDAGQSDSKDAIDRESCRPDFTILGYPVVSLSADFAHTGSARNLLGAKPTPEQTRGLSNELQVTGETPPAFLFHTSEDPGVDVRHSLRYYEALRTHKVPAEIHAYQWGPHGVGLASADPVVGAWKHRLAEWMRTSGLLDDCERVAVSGTVSLAGKPMRWGMIALHPLGENADRRPVAWAMVTRGGKFSIPAHRGAVVGKNRVKIVNFGDVQLNPTIRDEQRVDGPVIDVAAATSGLALVIDGE